ncbi:MAG TPA: GtrA family protein [Roseiarcus sp.]|jgi:putative flippase GtrA|nr:GtrA family protein [Roseiarcus sp.]
MSFVRFCIVGLANTLIGLAVIYAAMRFGNVQYIIANTMGYAVGAAISFVLNRSWTFRFDGAILPSAVQWALALAIAFAANLVAVIVAHEYFGVDQYFSQAFGVLVYTGLSYLGGRFYAFRSAGIEESP